MTKQEVLQGALALNDTDNKYTVTVEGDKIIIETKYRGTRVGESTFRKTFLISSESNISFDPSKQYETTFLRTPYCLRDPSKS